MTNNDVTLPNLPIAPASGCQIMVSSCTDAETMGDQVKCSAIITCNDCMLASQLSANTSMLSIKQQKSIDVRTLAMQWCCSLETAE